MTLEQESVRRRVTSHRQDVHFVFNTGDAFVFSPSVGVQPHNGRQETKEGGEVANAPRRKESVLQATKFLEH